MSAHLIFEFTANNLAKLSEYAAKAAPTVAAHGGRPLGIGDVAVLHGSQSFARGAIFEFPDRAAALAWHASADYQALFDLRSQAMDCSIALIG